MPQSSKEAAGSIDLHDVVLVPIKSLKKDPTNPNVMNERQMNGLRASMKRFGYLQPVIVDKNTMVIADGEHRATIYEESGRTEVPCILLDLKDDAERRLLRQTMNKLRGAHDVEKDSSEIEFLVRASRLNELSLLTGTDSTQLLAMLKREKQPIKDEMLHHEPKARCSEGQLWKLGDHRLLCDDSSIPENMNELIDGQFVKLLLMDAPYGIEIVNPVSASDGGAKVPGFRRGTPAVPGFSQTSTTNKRTHFASASGRVGAPGIVGPRIYSHGITNDDKPFDPRPYLSYGKNQIVFGANHFANRLPNNSHWLVWDKKGEHGAHTDTFSDAELMWTNLKGKQTKIYRQVWAGLLRTGDRGIELKDRVHPTQKPVGLLAQIISDHTEKDDIVLDPFAGSGSTIIACELTARKCLAMEIDPFYCDIILERYEKFTGKKAILVN